MTDLNQKQDAELHRPVYHYTPNTGWMNDPNGLVYHDGTYHLFYQAGENDRRWDHATSTDLRTWSHHGTKIPATDDIEAFSGGAVVDERNTAGFGNDAIVCMYTGNHDSPGEQDQRVAYSTNGGETVQKYDGNPVLSDGHDEWRDPNPFWYEPTENWRMVVSRVEQRDTDRPAGIEIYESENLLDWEYLDTYESGTESWECPDLCRLPVENANEDRWVMTVAVEWDHTEYHIGHFDGETFIAERAVRADAGHDFYAAQSWSNQPGEDRRTSIAWMNHWGYARDLSDEGWKGSATLPRELELRDTDRGIVPVQRPHDGLTAERTGTRVSCDDVALDATTDPLADVATDDLTVYELVADVDPGDADRVTFKLRADETRDDETRLVYRPAKRELMFDRTDAGQFFGKTGYEVTSHPLQSRTDGTVKLRVFVDRNVVTSVANDGEAMMTNQIYPRPTSTDTRVTVDGGTATLDRLRLYEYV